MKNNIKPLASSVFLASTAQALSLILPSKTHYGLHFTPILVVAHTGRFLFEVANGFH